MFLTSSSEKTEIYFFLSCVIKGLKIELTQTLENLPSPLFALRARGPLGPAAKEGIPPLGGLSPAQAGQRELGRILQINVVTIFRILIAPFRSQPTMENG